MINNINNIIFLSNLIYWDYDLMTEYRNYLLAELIRIVEMKIVENG